MNPSLAPITAPSTPRAGAVTRETICSGAHTLAPPSCKGRQVTSDLPCNCVLGPQPASKWGPGVPGLQCHQCFSLAARTGSSSCSTCTTTMATSPTAPCAARAASCSCAATRAAAGERSAWVRLSCAPRLPSCTRDSYSPRNLRHRDWEPKRPGTRLSHYSAGIVILICLRQKRLRVGSRVCKAPWRLATSTGEDGFCAEPVD